jgi:hypothetical protein
MDTFCTEPMRGNWPGVEWSAGWRVRVEFVAALELAVRRHHPTIPEERPVTDILRLVAGVILMLALLAGEVYLGHQVLAIVSRLLP